MAKSKNIAKQAVIREIVHRPLALIPCNRTEGKFETTIQGKTITAYFAKKPDENVLKLVKTILIDSHTSNHVSLNQS